MHTPESVAIYAGIRRKNPILSEEEMKDEDQQKLRTYAMNDLMMLLNYLIKVHEVGSLVATESHFTPTTRAHNRPNFVGYSHYTVQNIPLIRDLIFFVEDSPIRLDNFDLVGGLWVRAHKVVLDPNIKPVSGTVHIAGDKLILPSEEC